MTHALSPKALPVAESFHTFLGPPLGLRLVSDLRALGFWAIDDGACDEGSKFQGPSPRGLSRPGLEAENPKVP